MAQTELSEYEQQRKANIAERDALLRKLALDAADAGLGPKRTKQSPKGPEAPKRKVLPKRPKAENVPRRTSSRIAGLEADSEKAKRKAEEEFEAAQEAARIKRLRVSGDFQLKDIVVAGHEWSKSEGFFDGVVKRGAMPYERTFGDTEVRATPDKQLKTLRERMSNLELYGGFQPNRIKITPERIYSLGFHPEPTKALVFAGDKLGNLGIFDASQASEPQRGSDKIENGTPSEDEDEDDEGQEPAVTSIHPHTRTISSFQFSPKNPSQLLTCSYDSSIRLLDLASSSSTELYGPADPEADEPLSGVEVDSASPDVLYFSRLDGHVGRYDMRTPQEQAVIWQMSEKKIGGFSLHPQYPHFLATASLDRTMRLWDMRKAGKGRRPALLGEHDSRLSVSHAAFNSVGQVATSSYDDTIKIYSFTDMKDWKGGEAVGDAQMQPSHTVPHNNQTGRWVTILRPQWQVNPSDGVQRFVIGNMNRFVDIYSGSGQQLAQLGADSITAVPAVCQFHPTQDWVGAGTASGKLCLWM